MSVSGEFRRALDDCLAFLGVAGAGDVRSWTGPLSEAGRRGRQDLSAGAVGVLDFLESSPPQPSFHSELQKEEFAGLREHLEAICRVIIGAAR